MYVRTREPLLQRLTRCQENSFRSEQNRRIEGVDVVGSDGRETGKVAKVNALPDDKVTNCGDKVSGRNYGFFSQKYVVPAENLIKKMAVRSY